MAKIYINEYGKKLGNGGAEVMQTGNEPAIAYQSVNIGASSAQSSAFNSLTRFIRVHTDAICSIKIGSNPTAVVTETRLAADQTEYFSVEPGHKIAVITNT